MLSVGNTYNKQLFNLVSVGETLQHERYHESIVFQANHLANVLTKNQTTKKIHDSIQLNKPKQQNIINTINTR